MSRRTDIRTAFAALLGTLPSVTGRVFLGRTRPLKDAQLPAVLVFSGETEPQGQSIGGQQPDLTAYRLRADILVKNHGGIEDTADQILDEMTAAVFASTTANTLSGKVQSTRLIQIGEPDLDDSLEKPALRLPVLFEVIHA